MVNAEKILVDSYIETLEPFFPIANVESRYTVVCTIIISSEFHSGSFHSLQRNKDRGLVRCCVVFTSHTHDKPNLLLTDSTPSMVLKWSPNQPFENFNGPLPEQLDVSPVLLDNLDELRFLKMQ